MAHNRAWYLGVDLGTSSCKSVVINDQAQILGFGNSNYPGNNTQEKWFKQSPEAILEGMIRSVNKAITSSNKPDSPCAGLSLGGALHSVMALDKFNNPISDILTWADGRAEEYAKRYQDKEESQVLYGQTGCPVHSMYPLYKIIWLHENSPQTKGRGVKFLSAKEYVFFRLTGKYWIDYNLASGTGLFNIKSFEWNPVSLKIANIDTSNLSTPYPPTKTHIGINSTLANKMGLSPDTPITLGSSDATNSNVGSGSFYSWQATLNIGTSGAYRIISTDPILDLQARSWCYAVDQKHWLVGGAINNGGLVVTWLRNVLNRNLPDGAKEYSFDELFKLAESVEQGAEGLLCLPFLTGERSPGWLMNSRATFSGINLNHDLRHFTRAILEGVAYRLRSIDVVLEELGCQIKEIHASGGFIKSPLWLQIMADILNKEILV